MARLRRLNIDYTYFDAKALKAGLYGTTERLEDPRVQAMSGLFRQNLAVPMLLIDGRLEDISVWLMEKKRGAKAVSSRVA
ncbi:MAG TPA: hypothetical protein ENN09_07615 [Planctomycetes bacterium]|nr:hypothetical protein [Planctomycetota bacterium]